VNAEASELYFVAVSGACLSRNPEALHEFDFFRVSLHAGAADSSIVAQGMVSMRLRIGTMGLKIAAIVLSREATLLFRNLTDFGQVPGLQAEDWTA
jgi:predicted nucleic acid-binding protein